MEYLFAAPMLKGSYAFTQFFGANKPYYSKWGLDGHEGVDLGALQGTPIYAARDGFVKELYKTSYGNYGIHIALDHTIGDIVYKTLYAHMSKTADLEKGQAVVTGQLIGYVGWTGNVFPKNINGSHLHFTIMEFSNISRKYLNPYPLTDWEHVGALLPTGKVYKRTQYALRLRSLPSLQGEIITNVRSGVTLEISDQKETKDGYVWVKLPKQLINGQEFEGWIASQKEIIKYEDYLV